MAMICEELRSETAERLSQANRDHGQQNHQRKRDHKGEAA